MSYKAVTTGQHNLVNESDNSNFIPFPIADKFPAITGITKYLANNVIINSASGEIDLDIGQVDDMKGILLFVTGGSINLKHDSNTAGMRIDSGILLGGKISDLKISTTESQNVSVGYLVYQ
jgi:hypothetical protein